MKIVLFCTAFNGLSQRAWIELRAMGHDVTVHLASDAVPVDRICNRLDPDLVICPFLKDRVPDAVWRRYRTIIIHPGPAGDRGPSSLDRAIAGGERQWGVTALQAVEEMDAGPIWATRTFSMETEPVRKGALYNGPVADAATELIGEVVSKAVDPTFVPLSLAHGRPGVIGRMRPAMTQADRSFSWPDSTATILRSIRAADGAPGVRTTLAL
jgi:putative two-component system hydrogenase maturation factor HypX/HoxX